MRAAVARPFAVGPGEGRHLPPAGLETVHKVPPEIRSLAEYGIEDDAGSVAELCARFGLQFK